MHALSALSICALLLGLAHSNPIPKEFEEVIPGLGMPSLEELGLTSADLYEMSPVPLNTLQERALVKRATCRVAGAAHCQTANAQACVNYLNSLGTRDCVAQYWPPADMFVAAQCHVYGRTPGNHPFETSSFWYAVCLLTSIFALY